MRDDSAFVLRERHPWESIDLGALMLRRWFGRIAPLTIAAMAAAAATALIAAGERSWIALIALWWIKPLLDRFATAPAGVLLFSPRSSRADIAKPLRRSLGLSLIADLAWRRFSPWRAFLLPSRVFERAPAGTAGRRYRDLLANSRGWIIGATIIFEFLEWMMAFTIASSATNYLGIASAMIGTEGFAAALAISYALVICLTEPLYALSCFSLYINRRTIAEGWDLDLKFKLLASRSKEPRGGAAKALLLCVALALPIAAAPPCAAQAAQGGGAGASFSDRARAVLEDPVFGTPRTEKRIMLREGDGEDADEGDDGRAERGARVETLLDRLGAEGLRIAVAVLALALIASAIIVNRKSLASILAGGRAKARRDAARFEDASRRRALAEELAEARSLWESGDRRSALALAYDASVRAASSERGWRLGPSSTEGDCLREARRVEAAAPRSEARDAPGGTVSAPPEAAPPEAAPPEAPRPREDAAFAAAFSAAVLAWSRFAWAGSEPADEEFAAIVLALEEAAK